MDKRKCMLLMLCVLFFGLNWNSMTWAQAKSIAGDCTVTDQNAVVEETETESSRGNGRIQGNVRTAALDELTYGDFTHTVSYVNGINQSNYEGKINYYEIFDNGILSWEEAEAYCESLGGHLATLTSEEENDYVYQLMRDKGYHSAYFGLTDRDCEGTWVWVTGETVNYTNWYPEEPNNLGNENYAMFYEGFDNNMWNDGDFGGGGVTVFICEWDFNREYIDTVRIPATETHKLSSYGGTDTGTTNDNEIREAFKSLKSAIDSYFAVINGTIKTGANSSKNDISELRKTDESRKQPLLTVINFDDITGSEIDAAYCGVKSFLKKMDEETPTIRSKVDLSDDILTIAAKIEKEIVRLTGTYNINTKYNGYTVSGNILLQRGFMGIGNAFTGQIEVTNKKRTKIFLLCSDVDSALKATSGLMAEYLKLTEEVTKDGLKSYMSEWAKVTYLSDFTETEFKSLFSSVYDYLQEKGCGKVTKYAIHLYNGYKIAKDISSIVKADQLKEKLKNANDLYKEIKALDFSDSSIKDQSVKLALDCVQKKKENLETMLYNYIYHPDEKLDTDRGFFNKVGDWFSSGYKKITGHCPVTIIVYDQNGAVIGYASDEKIEYSDGIYIEVSGDVKTIYISDDCSARIEMVGTDEGEMNYTIEEFQNGMPVGRANYYNVPLENGSKYTQSISNKPISFDTYNSVLTNENGNSIGVDECILPQTNAVCNIACIKSNGGNVYGAGEYARGDAAELVAYAEEGYQFAGWYRNGVLADADHVYRLSVVEDVTMQALFIPNPQNQEITCSAASGLTINLDDADYNLQAATSGDGAISYFIDDGTIADISAEGIITPLKEGETTIYVVASETVKFKAKILSLKLEVKNGKTKFNDVPANSWYSDAVQWAVKNNITSGTGAGTFAPDATCTRGQIVTFLWRANGSPKMTGTANPFTDVPSGAFYYDAVLWAVKNGITSGTTATTFSPDAGCTRGQVVTFLYRSASDKSVSSQKNPFTDVPGDAYYTTPVLWAVQRNVTAGITPTTFGPDDTCSRSQIVTFMYRYMGK